MILEKHSHWNLLTILLGDFLFYLRYGLFFAGRGGEGGILDIKAGGLHAINKMGIEVDYE